jgi:hypothetical protein
MIGFTAIDDDVEATHQLPENENAVVCSTPAICQTHIDN